MNLHDWIDELCDVLEIEVDVDEALVLDLAREAAHNVERRAAPVSTFLLGYAAAKADADQEELERLAAVATGLALRWDRPADAGTDPLAELEVDVEVGAEVGVEIAPDEDPAPSS